MGTVAGLNRGVFCLDWSPTKDRIAIGGGDGTIRKWVGLDCVDARTNARACKSKHAPMYAGLYTNVGSHVRR